ncbi:ATPase AAA [Bacteroidia bacterium]|nr:ATPase AAA [Bacteroidia bacterium]
MAIIGRVKEQGAFNKYFESEKSELVAVYGRRRVGKTFLIKEFFKEQFSFYISGLPNSNKDEQLENFAATLTFYGKMPYPKVNSWLEAFRQLIYMLENSRKKGKKVVFIDELPWFDTPRSGFLTALDFFWNTWASGRNDILLIVCGSATSWMINKLLRNKGGLHNRVTRRMHLSPFTLKECEDFFRYKKMVFDRKSIAETYMVFGGIPFYLEMFEKGESVAQNIDNLCFNANAALKDEFSLLYASLFRHSENYVKVVSALAKKTKGLTREEIIAETSLQGGGLTTILDELEQCDFIRSYQAFSKKKKSALFQLTDFFSLFHFKFMTKNEYKDEQFWTNSLHTPLQNTWAGYAFEMLVLQHINEVKRALGISGVQSAVSSWRSENSSPAAQIDLLIDRKDGIIDLCEIKFSKNQFVIDKDYEKNLRNKISAFISENKTRKAIHILMITTYGTAKNKYYDIVQKEVVLNDLFI